MTDQLAIIRRLERERDEAREHVARLLDVFGGSSWMPPEWLRLTPRRREVLGVLVRRSGWVTREQITLVLESRPISRFVLDPKNVDVYILHLRRTLAPWGIVIETQAGVGWRLNPAGRRKLLASETEGLRA